MRTKTSKNLELDEKLECEYKNTLSRECNDYIRTGDQIILKRILFKLYATHNGTDKLKREKAHALMMLMVHDNRIISNLTLM